MYGSKEHHHENELEEGDKDVRIGESEGQNSQNRGDRTLKDRHPEMMKSFGDSSIRVLLLCRHESVRDVSREVYREPNAHDQIDHRDGVQVHIPERHVADDPGLDGDDGEGNP